MRARSGHVHSATDQNMRLPMVNGGSPPKKRQMRSLPPLILHLQYEPTSGSDWKRSCGLTPPMPFRGHLPTTAFSWYMPMVGPRDASAEKPGRDKINMACFPTDCVQTILTTGLPEGNDIDIRRIECTHRKGLPYRHNNIRIKTDNTFLLELSH